LGIGGTMFFAYLETFWVAFFNIVNGVATVIVIGLMAYFGKSITASAIVFFGITLLISAISTGYFLYKRKWNLFRIRWKLIFNRVWKLLAQSFMFAVLQISGTFMYNAMTIVVTANIGLKDAAEFNLVQKIYTFIMAVYLSLYNPLWAGYSDATFRNDWAWVKRTLIKTIFGTILLFGLALLVFAFFGNFFLMLLAGNNYSSQSMLFMLMGLWAMFYSLYLLGIAFLSATSRINLITILSAVFAFVFVSVATYFGRKASIEGVAAWAVVSFLILALATYWQGFSIVKNRSRRPLSQ
jgi:O-antigen/teichoic acid export membrane protein